MQRSATREAHSKRFVVGVAERDDSRSALTVENRQGFMENGAFDAPTGHRAGDLTVAAHGHGGAGVAGPGTFDTNDTRDCYLLALTPPTFDIGEDLTHEATLLRGPVHAARSRVS